jgi:sigma-B regulation protein RsbU (phosphoserine phosphatase)
MRLSIRWKLILSICLPLLAVYGSMLAWDYNRLVGAAREQLQNQALRQAETIAQIIDGKLGGIRLLVDSTAGGLSSRNTFSESPVRNMLGAGMRPGNWVHSVAVLFEPNGAPLPNVKAGRRTAFIVRRGGPILGSMKIADSYDYTKENWYQAAREKGGVVWSDPFRMPFIDGKESDKEGLAVVCAAPFTHDDKFAGVVAAFVRLEDLQDLGGGSTAERRPPGQAAPGPQIISPLTPGELGPLPTVVLPPSEPIADVTGEPQDRDKTRKPKSDKDRPPPASKATRAVLFDPLTRAALGFAEDGYYIIDHEGRFISHRNKDLIQKDSMFRLAEKPKYKDVPGIEDLEAGGRQALNGGTGVARVEGLDEIIPNYTAADHHWIAFTALRTTGWAFVTAIPEGRVMGPTIQRLLERASFLAGGLVLLVGIVMIASIRMSRPIEKLASAVGRLADGDLDVHVDDIRTRDEIGQLASAFNTMTLQLKSHVKALTEQSAAREKIESELRIARQIQTDLLPRKFPPFPERPEFDLHGVNASARQVAGDFFDFFFTPAGLLTLVIADVSGKGVPAALLMAVTRTIIRNLAMEKLSPAEIVGRANQMLVADSGSSMFVTLFLAQYDPATGRIVYCNAGHPLPYRLNGHAPPAAFGQVTGPILGVCVKEEMGRIEQHGETLEPGQTLLLYTDGATEARDPQGRMLTAGGLERLLRELPPSSVHQMCAGLIVELDRFQSGHRADDITLVALRRNY